MWIGCYADWKLCYVDLKLFYVEWKLCYVDWKFFDSCVMYKNSLIYVFLAHLS